MLRSHSLWQATDALVAAGQPRLADVAEAAAARIGGTDQSVEDLLFEVDCLISRREHAI